MHQTVRVQRRKDDRHGARGALPRLQGLGQLTLASLRPRPCRLQLSQGGGLRGFSAIDPGLGSPGGLLSTRMGAACLLHHGDGRAHLTRGASASLGPLGVCVPRVRDRRFHGPGRVGIPPVWSSEHLGRGRTGGNLGPTRGQGSLRALARVVQFTSPVHQSVGGR